jgi:predicted AAA+ superfamily ATPase
MESLFATHRRIISGFKPVFRRNFIDSIIWDEQLIGIKGARGVGKTSLLLQYIKEKYGSSQDCLYVSLDDATFPYNSIIELAENFSNVGGKCLVLDEIHKYTNWAQELKNIYDRLPELKVVFTGSSVLHIHTGKADLSRRAVVYNMHGLSFREFLEIETKQKFEKYSLVQILENHEDIATSIVKVIKPLAYFKNYFQYGYYPYYLQNKLTYPMKLSATISLTLEIDLPYLLNVDVRYINKLKRLLYILSTNAPFKPNILKLAESLDMSRQTVVQYLNYLHESEVINLLYTAGKGYGTLSKPEKVYLRHPNLAYAINSLNTEIGTMRETFFFNQLSNVGQVDISEKSDFLVNEKYTFEVGGRNKNFKQIQGIDNAYIASDEIEIGYKQKIPLWLFGFLY